jgi:hypothetical protein
MLGTDDVMRNGQQLIDLLSECGSWLVIHGHKHHPKIEYAAGQDDQPIILACGSFSGRLEGPNASVSRNYFHLVDISLTGPSVQGRVTSWTWASGFGWKQYADAESRFPSEFGFGYHGQLVPLAANIAKQLDGAKAMEWSDLVRKEPSLTFLMPKQLRKLIEHLRAKHQLNIVFDEYSRPQQIGERL